MKVYFPVVNLETPASVGPPNNVSPIELLVLRAVVAGCDRLSDLQGLFGLPVRMTMHLVTGLVRRNLVLVNFGAGRLKVPQGVAEKITQGEPREEMKGSGTAVTAPRQMKFSLNKCTGRLGRPQPLRLPGPDALVFRPQSGWVEPDDLEQIVIVDALNHQLRREGLRVFDLDKSMIRPIGEGYLEAEVRAVEWGHEGSVTLAFAEMHHVPATEVARLEEFLLRCKEEMPAIWERLHPVRRDEPESRRRALRVLPQSLAHEAASIRSHFGRPPTGKELSRLLQRAANEAASASPVRLLAGSEQIWDAAAGLLAQARRQALIMMPFLADAPATELLRAQTNAAVKIVLVHGIDSALTEDEAAVATRLSDSPGLQVMTERGASTHAKVVVQDDRRVLVGSKNLLSSSRSSPKFDVGVELDGDAAVAEVLAWLREVAPPEVRAALRIEAVEGKGVERTYYRLPPSEGLPETFGEVVGLVESEVGALDTAATCAEYARAVEAWTAAAAAVHRETFAVDRQHVATYLDKLVKAMDAARHAAVEIIPTEQHRPLLFDALDSARRFVVVTSHQIGGSAMGANLRGAILHAVERGVQVAILWGSDPEAGSDPREPTKVQQFVRELQAEAIGHSGRLLINDAPLAIHCKTVVVDGHAAVVSSFEFLHFADSTRYRRHELGVWIGSPAIANALVEALAAHSDTRDPDFAAALRALAR